MKHYFVSGVVRTKRNGHRGYAVIEENGIEQREFVTVWTRDTREASIREARLDALNIAKGLNLVPN